MQIKMKLNERFKYKMTTIIGQHAIKKAYYQKTESTLLVVQRPLSAFKFLTTGYELRAELAIGK